MPEIFNTFQNGLIEGQVLVADFTSRWFTVGPQASRLAIDFNIANTDLAGLLYVQYAADPRAVAATTMTPKTVPFETSPGVVATSVTISSGADPGVLLLVPDVPAGSFRIFVDHTGGVSADNKLYARALVSRS